MAFASRTLSAAEQNYAQVDKEALAVVFGVTKFHQYIGGRPVKIFTDHRPLVHLLVNPTPPMASPRLTRWLLLLSAYEFSIEFRPGKKHGNADALSRLPHDSPPRGDPPLPPEVYLLSMSTTRAGALCARDVAKHTGRDTILAQVLKWTREGWPDSCPDGALTPFFRRRADLSIINDTLMWGERMVIPSALRAYALDKLHEPHQGVVKTKRLARSLMWWPGLDADIERCIGTCALCQADRPMPPLAPYKPWPEAAPWERLHVDFAGPLNGQYLMILVDAGTNWIEAWHVSALTTKVALDRLEEAFAQHGLPEVVVSDNGPAFASAAFSEHLARKGVRHITPAPYCPYSNGPAERAVRTVKALLKRFPGGQLRERLQRVLQSHRFTPGANGLSPAQRLNARQPRTLAHKLCATGKDICFPVGTLVWAAQYTNGKRSGWMPGTVLERNGSVMYVIQLFQGTCRRRRSQLRRRTPGMQHPGDDVEQLGDDTLYLDSPSASPSTSTSRPT